MPPGIGRGSRGLVGDSQNEIEPKTPCFLGSTGEVGDFGDVYYSRKVFSDLVRR